MTASLLTLPEVLAVAAERGLELTERTFRYYAVVGLLPKPLKSPGGHEDARVHYYPPDIVDRLLQIRTLQSQGYSLKQIKSWLAVKSDFVVVAEGGAKSRPEGAAAISDVVAFLSRDGLHEATRAFLEEALIDDREETLRRAALAWVVAVASGLRCGEATKDGIRAAVEKMSPLDIDALVAPLRRLRDEERRRAALDQEAPLVTALRGLALRMARGLPFSDAESRRLDRYASALEDAKSRLGQLPRACKSLAPEVLAALRKSLDRLSHVVGILQSDGDANAALRALARASTELGAAASVLEGLRLLTRAGEGEQRG